MTSILRVFDPTSKTWKGVPAIKGEKGERGEKGDRGVQGVQGVQGIQGIQGLQGFSSYDLAVKAGYTGSETQFGAEQAAVANNSARLAAVEVGKASLDNNGYVASELIDPLQGKQTGYIHTGSMGTFGSATMVIPEASVTYELLMDAVQIEHPTGMAVLNTSSPAGSSGRCIYLYKNKICAYYNARASYAEFSVSPLVNGMTHLIVVYDYENKVISCMLNGQILTKNIPDLTKEQTTGFYLARSSYNTSSPYYQNRVFDRSLTTSEMLWLWNNGNPQNYRLIDKSSLLAEYIPEYLSLTEWKDSSGNRNDLTVSGTIALTYGYNSSTGLYKGSVLTPLFVARGAVYNDKTGYYELNGLTDITEAQMINIYNYTSQTPSNDNWKYMFWTTNKVRTNFSPKSVMDLVNMNNSFSQNDFEVIIVVNEKYISANRMVRLSDFSSAFDLALKLKKVIGIINIYDIKNSFRFRCPELQDIKLFNLKVDVNLEQSSNFTNDSIMYMVNNSANTAPITLTLHADAFARLTEVDIALASSRNITIAVA